MFEMDFAPGLKLRLPEPKDAEEMFLVVDKNRSRLRKWLGWLDRTACVDDVRSFIDHVQKLYYENGAMSCLILREGKIIGMASFHPIDRTNRKADLGYWLAQEAEGEGIMTRAISALVDHAFIAMRLNRVSIRCAQENTQSQGIPKRLGFRLEGVERNAEWLYEHFVDHEVYSKLAVEHDRTNG